MPTLIERVVNPLHPPTLVADNLPGTHHVGTQVGPLTFYLTAEVLHHFLTMKNTTAVPKIEFVAIGVQFFGFRRK